MLVLDRTQFRLIEGCARDTCTIKIEAVQHRARKILAREIEIREGYTRSTFIAQVSAWIQVRVIQQLGEGPALAAASLQDSSRPATDLTRQLITEMRGGAH